LEINRLFRTTAYNITERIQYKSKLEKKFPCLSDIEDEYQKLTFDEQVDKIIDNIKQRANIKMIEKRQITEYPYTENIKPGYNKLSTLSAMKSRSPLISIIRPSPCDLINKIDSVRRVKLGYKVKNKGLIPICKTIKGEDLTEKVLAEMKKKINLS